MQERIRTVLQVESGGLCLASECGARLTLGDEHPSRTSVSRLTLGDEAPSRTSVSLSSSFREVNCPIEEGNCADKKGIEEDSEIFAELKAAKSLLEIYKQRSGDLVHANEDLRNQLFALQMENETLKIQNEELKSRNESLIKANQVQAKDSDNSSPES
jgi:glycine cleavage system H lipoate-binding protein